MLKELLTAADSLLDETPGNCITDAPDGGELLEGLEEGVGLE